MNYSISFGAAMRALSIGLALAAGPLLGQTPSFDVASIKKSEPVTPAMIQSGKIHVGMKIDGVRVDIGNYPLMRLIMTAWDVKLYQVKGDNTVLLAQPFDIVANLPAGATKEQVPAMLQKLLEERFKLKVHTETEPQTVYALVIAEGGEKLKQSAPAAEALPEGVSGTSTADVKVNKGGGATVSTAEGIRQTTTPSPDGKSIHFEISGATMDQLAEGLAPLTDQPIVNRTGLKGRYDASFDISVADIQAVRRNLGLQAAGDAPAAEASDPGASVFSAMKAMGLKLEKRKEPMLKVIVDHCEKMPTDN